MAMHECDGCHKVIDLTDEQEADLNEYGFSKHLPDSCCKDFWGWMEVGGEAWYDYHDKGIHPMSGITASATKLLKTQ